MRNYWIGIGVVILASVWLWHALAEQPQTAAAGDNTALIKQGEYLANQVAHCSHCHSPMNDKGQPDAARLLQGGVIPFQPKNKTNDWANQSPDLTRSGLAGKWTEAEMIKFLTTGENPDGMGPIPPMPVFHLKQEDARAVTLYLRSLPGKEKVEAK